MLMPHELEAGQGFGTSLAALELELLVGAPGADEARGRVDAFGRGDVQSEWHATGSFEPNERTLRADFGAAVALGAGLAVVGSPGAEGRAGIAAVYELGEDGRWSSAVWLRASSPPVAITSGEVRCEEDAAAGFACADVDLQAYLPLASIGAGPGERVSDAWGWTDQLFGLRPRFAGSAPDEEDE